MSVTTSEAARHRRRVLMEGPDEVMVDKSGTCVPALSRGVKHDVILIRDDGRSLGCPSSLESAALAAWSGRIVCVIRGNDKH